MDVGVSRNISNNGGRQCCDYVGKKKHHVGKEGKVARGFENSWGGDMSTEWVLHCRSPQQGRCIFKWGRMLRVDIFSCVREIWHQWIIWCGVICSTNMIYYVFRYMLTLDNRNFYRTFCCVLLFESGLPNFLN